MKNKSEWSNFDDLSPGTNFWPASRWPSVEKEKNDLGNLFAIQLALNIPQWLELGHSTVWRNSHDLKNQECVCTDDSSKTAIHGIALEVGLLSVFFLCMFSDWQEVTVKEQLTGKGKLSRRSISSPNVNRVSTRTPRSVLCLRSLSLDNSTLSFNSHLDIISFSKLVRCPCSLPCSICAPLCPCPHQ